MEKKELQPVLEKAAAERACSIVALELEKIPVDIRFEFVR